jgi:hypothetical protein
MIFWSQVTASPNGLILLQMSKPIFWRLKMWERTQEQRRAFPDPMVLRQAPSNPLPRVAQTGPQSALPV